MKLSRRIPWALLGVGLVVGAWMSGAARAAESDPGLAIGERAPEFELKDAHGVTRSLSELQGGSTLALVFHRSADW